MVSGSGSVTLNALLCLAKITIFRKIKHMSRMLNLLRSREKLV